MRISRFHGITGQSPVFLLEYKFYKHWQKITEKQKLNFYSRAPFPMKSKVCLKNFVHDCLGKQFFSSNSPRAASNLDPLTIFETLSPVAQFQHKIKAVELEKVLKFVSYGNSFSRLFKFGIVRLSSLVQVVFWKKKVRSSPNVTVFNILSLQ